MQGHLPCTKEGHCRGQEDQPRQLPLLLPPQVQKDSKPLLKSGSPAAPVHPSTHTNKYTGHLSQTLPVFTKTKRKTTEFTALFLLNREQRADVIFERQAEEKELSEQTLASKIPLAQTSHTLGSEAAQPASNKVRVPTVRSEEQCLLSGTWVPKNNVLGCFFLNSC